MLALRRKKNDKIIMSNGVTIMVVRVQHGVVRLGITAPDDVEIVRDDAIDKTPRKRAEFEADQI